MWPAAASRSAIARPMPLLPPVTSTEREGAWGRTDSEADSGCAVMRPTLPQIGMRAAEGPAYAGAMATAGAGNGATRVGPHGGRSRGAQAVITSVRPGRSSDLSARERRYLLTMGIRVACFIGMIFIGGVGRWVLLVGAAFLPAIAVMLANVIDKRGEGSRAAPLPDTDRPALPERSTEVVPGEVVDEDR
ncbi:hypothetical protein CGZ96_17690 [Enemella evansiae]|nr:hypothetical protein CGZ96_17690 [Enemella evansiae]